MNVLEGFLRLKDMSNFSVRKGIRGNSVQLVGSGLEDFVKKLYRGDSTDSKVFSLLGNANNPPDLILKNGEAIEIKKVDGFNAEIQLNSSAPKQRLYALDTRISKACRGVALREDWREKDFFYIIGSIKNKSIVRLWFVHGECYAASKEVYDSVSDSVTTAIHRTFEPSELGDTNEIASILHVDPLNITRLRVRGMWLIKNPSVVFKEVLPENKADGNFLATMVLTEEKYISLLDELKLTEEYIIKDGYAITKSFLPNPNNPAENINGVILTYEL